MTSSENQSSPAPQLPHGEFKKVFDNIWFIQGQVKMPMKLPAKISRSMTVYKDPASDDLSLINSMRLSREGLDRLQGFGRIANVIRLGGFHGRDDLFYRREFDAKVYAIEGQVYARAMDAAPSPSSGYMEPDVWVSDSAQLPIADCRLKVFTSSNPPEAALLLEQNEGVLVTADALHNTPAPDQFVNFPMKLMMKKFGFWKPCNVGPGWLQFAKPQKADVRSIFDLEFAHVLPGHGTPVIDNAMEQYRPAIEGELKGCRS